MNRCQFVNMRDDLQTAQHLTEWAQLAARAPLADALDWTRLQRSIETVLGMVADRLGDAQSNLVGTCGG